MEHFAAYRQITPVRCNRLGAEENNAMNNFSIYENCILCPRKCGADRTKRKGACGQTAALKIGRASLHMWEEPCISGLNGSGTVFFRAVRSAAYTARTAPSAEIIPGKRRRLTDFAKFFLSLWQRVRKISISSHRSILRRI